MSVKDLMYDEVEHTSTRYVGFLGENSRFDLAITETTHFFGKKLVYCLQTGRAAILTVEEVDDVEYVAEAFKVEPMEAEELAEFLSNNL